MKWDEILEVDSTQNLAHATKRNNERNYVDAINRYSMRIRETIWRIKDLPT